ncbi:4-carboxy-4-hydroxy-2-oxoadipate aldolase/oxaloacetate decarboxylase [Siculibacillus lacustris]|uniref:4-carboxy-4-hydroxy-2-oxoadipate aldolase/oxaloacetate decarboxylase n=1 Tax=Siculibacillus lacustris TaxID=1549641 RepID=A0A4Q9VXR2_9HYPH|nr:4-carboxy-4-hydroxy-2-oxoadipate aldolase/oxaloacetate decarboxylase [Siculibacillus lacustris]TBW41282.1 4-carboxy-4-hydroxy-2-oxoadipate aldolase/oxaloacetate decarboxylase [Siculibacillus lacustris]
MTASDPTDPVALARRLLAYGSAAVFDAQGRRGALASRIKPLAAGWTVAGPAFTCQCEPGDNLSLHAALKMARPGEVIVCDARGATEQGMFGDVMSSCGKGRGLGGLVTDGGVRDSATIAEVGFPVFAGNICIKGTVKEVLGPLNLPIVLGGVAVRPGDLVIGDDDGVVIVAPEAAEAVLARCADKAAREAALIAALADGATPWDLNGHSVALAARGIVVDF